MPNSTANAITNIPSQSTNLGEMLLDGYEDDATGKVFNAKVFLSLISQISGVENPNKNTIDGLTTTKTSADFRTLNGKDIVVVIDGIPWTATYLSTNEKGEPILTLWQADAMNFSYFNASTNAMVNNTATTTWTTSDNYVDSISKYPSNSYGTSFMATSVLNNGGAWARTGSDTEDVTQNKNSTYAKFTMSGVKGSLTQFIDVPNDVPFQKDANKESAKTHSFHSQYRYDANNDVLGAPISGNMYDAASTYYTNSTVDMTGYLSWGNDKIWLPSFAEVGYSTDGGATSGLWKTSTNQRAITASLANYSWLRSTYYPIYRALYVLDAAGSSITSYLAAYSHAVRPAFHLNLKTASEHLGIAKPQDISIEYTGNQLSLGDVPTEQKTWYDSSFIDLTYPSGMTDAGTHKVTAKIKSEYQAMKVKFDGTPDTSKGETEYIRYFDFVITQKTLRADFNTTVSPPTVKAVLEDLVDKIGRAHV